MSATDFLQVWLPFDESTTQDLCGNEWAAYGNPTISDGQLSLDASSYLQKSGGITLGGQDFTIAGWAKMDADTTRWYPGIFACNGNKLRLIGIGSNTTGLEIGIKGSVYSITTPELTERFHWEIDYTHSSGLWRLFINGSQVFSQTATLNHTTYNNVYIGSNGDSNARYWGGTIDEFQIYDGIALHTENFTPPTDADYLAQAWELVDEVNFSFDADTERQLDALLQLDFNTERVIENQSFNELQTLRVWLPFNESTTQDLCGNEWTAYGNPTISDGQLSLDGSSYLQKSGGITLGGQDFTICGRFNTGSTGNWSRIFSLHNESESNATINLMRKEKGNQFACQCLVSTAPYFTVTLNVRHHFELSYSYAELKLRVFIDGILVSSSSGTIPRTTFANLLIGKGNFTADDNLVGTVDEFQIYDGVALHTENFTPPTDADYLAQALELTSKGDFSYDADTERQLDALLQLDFNTERVIENQSFNELQTLRVWLPFDESTTKDLCGNTWTAHHATSISPANAISLNALQCAYLYGGDSATLAMNGGITLGGQSFTIRGWFKLTQTSNMTPGCRIFGLFDDKRTSSGSIFLKRECRGTYITLFVFGSSTVDVAIEFGKRYFYEVDYNYAEGKFRLFLNGALMATLNKSITETKFARLELGYSYWSSDSAVGTFDEFQIFDGKALHSDDFAPPNEMDYIQSKLDFVGEVNFSFDIDTEREVVNSNLVFCYVNPTDFFSGINSLEMLGATKSKIGIAFYQTEQTKCIEVPPLYEVWLEFDVYFNGSQRWRAYNKAYGQGACGITAQTDGRLLFFANDVEVRSFSGICIANQLQTVCLHMITGTTRGAIEAWVSGVKVYTYIGDVNHGEPFNDLFLQSDGAGTCFSCVTISNAELTSENYIERATRLSDFANFNFGADTERTPITGDVTAWLPFVNSPTEDLCGNPWITKGEGIEINSTEKESVPVSNEANYVLFMPGNSGNSSLGGAGLLALACQGIYLGGKDFSVSFRFWIGGGISFSESYPFLFCVSGERKETGGIYLNYRERFNSGFNLLKLCAFGQSTAEFDPGYRDGWHNVKVEYNHGTGTLNFWYDETLKGTIEITIPRTFFTTVEINAAHGYNEHLSGFISNFQIIGGETAPDCGRTIYLCVCRNGEVIKFPLRNYEIIFDLAFAVLYDGKIWYNVLRDPSDQLASDFYIFHDGTIRALSK